MSYIFEALQRAEAERSGESQPKNAESVAELLREVEQQIARKQPAGEPGNGDVPRKVELASAKAVAESGSDTGNIEATGAGAMCAATAVELAIAAPETDAKLTVDATIVEKTKEETKEVLSTVQPEFPRQRSGSVPAADSVTGAALAAAAAPEIAAQFAGDPVPSSPGTAASPTTSTAIKTFADATVVSPSLPIDSRLVCLTDQGGLAAEKFRVLGLKLRHLREQRTLKRVVVTGTAPEEGKSVVAANLALNQSRSKVLKTLLVDGDLRRPTVATRFGFDRSLAGLSECLRGERKLTEVVYKLNGSGLYLLPAGCAPENPLDLMQSGRLPELLDELGKFFDWIVIDTPPVIPVADTAFWMKLADGVLVVVREGVSEKKVVERALESFDRASLLGVVVNSCSRSDHKDYYSRYSRYLNPTNKANNNQNHETN